MQHDIRAPNRLPPTLAQRFNPLWWAIDTMKPANASTIGWFIRNPGANFFNVILGLAHQAREVQWKRGEGWTFAAQGWNYGYSRAFGGFMWLPFVSYRGRYVECALGWMTSGTLTLGHVRRANAHQP
jgi:hypothetical protein